MKAKQIKKLFLALGILWVGIQLTFAQAPVSNEPSPSYQGTHGFSTYRNLKYPPDFTHFEYVNPDAPKGGTIRLGGLGTFDSLNLYIVKGVPPGLVALTAATLLEEARDCPGESYAYAAESVELAPDRSWVIFRLNPKAAFNNGDPVTADDVLWVFEALRTQGAPIYRTYYKNITKAEKLDDHTVKFTFNTTTNKELPLILGQLPILSKKYFTSHPFGETSLKPCPSSGPYEIESVSPGHYIVLKHVKNWWGAAIPSQKGCNNFDKIRSDYYLESNALFEGFKSHQYDVRQELIAKNWATAYTFPAFQQGLIKKEELRDSLPAGTIGLFFNIRRPIFSDIRVRKALTLLFDFSWMNKHLFYGLYHRNTSYYPNSDYEAKGLPSLEEKAILEPFQAQLPTEVLTQAFTLPAPQTEEDHRALQTQSQKLLKEAGYEVKDTIMVNTTTGKPLVIDTIIFDKGLEKVFLNFAESLKRLGIQLRIRFLDTAAYQLRLDNLDFDMVYSGIPQTQSLGNEQRDFFGSEKSNTPGTRNFAGIQNPVVDKLVELLINSKNYETLVNNARALDRVLLWNYYMIPTWHSNVTRIAYWDRFSRPKILPKYHAYSVITWWLDKEKDAKLAKEINGKTTTTQTGPSFWSKIKAWFS